MIGSPTLARAYELRGEDILAQAEHEHRSAEALSGSCVTQPGGVIRARAIVAKAIRLLSSAIMRQVTRPGRLAPHSIRLPQTFVAARNRREVTAGAVRLGPE